MTLKKEPIGVENSAEWDAFAAALPYANAFQSAALLLALGKNREYVPAGRLFREAGSNRVIGGYVFHVIREVKGPAALIGTRAILNGGPLLASEDPELYRELLADASQHPNLGGVYLEVWHNRSVLPYLEAYRELGFSFSEHLNFHIDLAQSEDSLWGNISKRRRQYIRKNFERIVIRPVETPEDFGRFYDRLAETYSRVKVPLIPAPVFEDVLKQKLGWFLLAECDNSVIASRVVLNFGRTLYDWYAGSSDGEHDFHANESLVWHVLKRGQAEGYRWFDFGGAGKPNKPYGPREFKARFGGPLVNFGRHRLVLSKTRAALLNAALTAREKLVARTSRHKSG